MVTRNSYTSASSAFSADDLVDDLAEKADVWFDNMSLIPTSITNSVNDYTIVIDPALKIGEDVGAGMRFFIIPNADNTGTVRIRVTSSGSYYALKKADGTNLAAGQFNQQSVYEVLFIDGEFRMLNSSSLSIQNGVLNEQVFNSSGTWTKPDDMPTGAIVEVWLWGGGGGGNSNSGGGGGAGIVKQFDIGDLTGTVSVTVGAGGTAGTNGGTSTFGSYLSAYGGGGGNATAGGGGGGLKSAGNWLAQGAGGRGGGGGSNSKGTSTINPGFCGGGGGQSTSNQGGDGVYGGGGGVGNGSGGGAGQSIFGGGGGGSNLTAIGDLAYSIFGGNGGIINATPAVAPTVPGGGGTGSGTSTYTTGAAGQCIVRVIA